jgi:hypothetical protein
MPVGVRPGHDIERCRSYTYTRAPEPALKATVASATAERPRVAERGGLARLRCIAQFGASSALVDRGKPASKPVRSLSRRDSVPGRTFSCPPEMTTPAVLDLFKDDERDDAGTRALRILVVAVVVIIHAAPELAALGFLNDPWAHGDVIAIDLNRDRVGVRADVVVPGRVLNRAGSRSDDDEPSVVWRVEQRGGARLV